MHSRAADGGVRINNANPVNPGQRSAVAGSIWQPSARGYRRLRTLHAPATPDLRPRHSRPAGRLRRPRAQPARLHDRAPRGSGVKQLIVLLAVAFVVTLGVVVGTRMSSDAIAVLVGVIAGVAASIPCALLLLVVTRRQQAAEQSYPPDPYSDRHRGPHTYEQRAAPPPVIVITPGSAPQQMAPWSTASWSTAPEGFEGLPSSAYGGQPASRRQFRVMGYEEAEGPADWDT